MEEEASTTSMEEEEEEFKRWLWQVLERWQLWQPGSVVAGRAPDRLLSEEEDLKPGEVEFESMEAARDALCARAIFTCSPAFIISSSLAWVLSSTSSVYTRSSSSLSTSLIDATTPPVAPEVEMGGQTKEEGSSWVKGSCWLVRCL